MILSQLNLLQIVPQNHELSDGILREVALEVSHPHPFPICKSTLDGNRFDRPLAEQAREPLGETCSVVPGSVQNLVLAPLPMLNSVEASKRDFGRGGGGGWAAG